VEYDCAISDLLFIQMIKSRRNILIYIAIFGLLIEIDLRHGIDLHKSSVDETKKKSTNLPSYLSVYFKKDV